MWKEESYTLWSRALQPDGMGGLCTAYDRAGVLRCLCLKESRHEAVLARQRLCLTERRLRAEENVPVRGGDRLVDGQGRCFRVEAVRQACLFPGRIHLTVQEEAEHS